MIAKKIEIGKIDIEDSYLHLFKNNTKRLEAGFHKMVLNEMVRSIKTPIKIDTIQIFNLDYDFELLNRVTHLSRVVFNRFIDCWLRCDHSSE